MKRFGTDYGGFYYPENLNGLDKNSIIYCIGAGEDISHDDCVLFSPACSSLDMFKDYKDRGDTFKRLIKDLNDE